MATKPSISAAPARARLRRLISNGYLPAELPLPFTSTQFARHAEAFAAKWDGVKIRKLWTAAEAYNIPRYGHARRKLSLVNPVSQLHVSHLISGNWDEIQKRLQRSKITEFKPEISPRGKGRAVRGVNFDGVSRRRAEILSSFGRYVKTDVARFYPSVYTHSIPWALHGKDWVKANFNTTSFKSGFADKLDSAVRSCQQGQTIGLPIGPDTSRILSELIATEIEEITRKTLTDLDDRAVRYVDDILIGLREDEAAPNVLSHVSSSLYEYELELNAEKTTTFGVGFPHNPEWINYIRTFDISQKPGRQRYDLDSFFEQAFYLADVNPRENVMLFAAKRAASFDVDPSNLKHLTRWLLYATRRAPTCLSFVAEHLAALAAAVGDLPTSEIETFILHQIKVKAEFAHTDEVAWLLFWAREVGLNVPSSLLSNVTSLRSSVTALLTLDLNQLGRVVGALDTSLWESFATPEGLKSEMWLVCYEATKKGWWPKPTTHTFVSQAAFFADIWKKGVEFYDPSRKARRRIKPVFQGDGSFPVESLGGFAGYPD